MKPGGWGFLYGPKKALNLRPHNDTLGGPIF